MSDSLPKDAQLILCDMCTGEDRKPALKTCMKCEISMCAQHLEAHLTTPVLLQTHPLTEPMAPSGTTKCPQHGKLLEYYCLDDMTCLCVSCAIEGQHRMHNMKTFSTAHIELMGRLKADQKTLQLKTDDEDLGLEKWEASEREKLGHSSVRLIEAVTNMRDISLSRVQSSVSARMVSIKTSRSSIQAAQSEKDTFRFLQMYSQVHQDVEKAKAADLRKGLEPGSDRDKLVEELRKWGESMTEQAGQFWCSLMTLVDPENHHEFVATRPDLHFDPHSLSSNMSLSQNGRRIFHSSWMSRSIPAHTVLIKTTCDFDRLVVGLSETCNWTVGLCDTKYAQSETTGEVYALRCQGEELLILETDDLTSQSNSKHSAQVENGSQGEKRKVFIEPVLGLLDKKDAEMTRPVIVEIVYNSDNSLTFFSRTGEHRREEIASVTISSPKKNLVPFVSLQKDELQNSSSRNSFGSFSQCNQQQRGTWKCYCGKLYTEFEDKYTHGDHVYPKSLQRSCPCGVIFGSRVTEVLCELL